MPKNTFQTSGTTVTEKRGLNFIPGTNVTITMLDGVQNDEASVQFDVNAFTGLSESHGGTLYNASGLSAGGTIVVWRAPFAGTVTKVYGYRNGGTGATVNASIAGNDLLASDKSLTSADTWMDGGTVQNATVAAGDALAIDIASVAGSPTYVSVQVDLTRA